MGGWSVIGDAAWSDSVEGAGAYAREAYVRDICGIDRCVVVVLPLLLRRN